MITETKQVIWILNHYAVSPDLAGGTRHYDLAKKLSGQGYNVTIFASAFDYITHKYVKASNGESFKIENHNGVRFVWLKTTPYQCNDWRRVLNMLSYGIDLLRFNKSFEKPDVIIGSSVHPVAPMIGWWLSRKYNARFIFEVRDLWPQTLVDMGSMKSNSLITRMLYSWEKFMYNMAEKIIVLLPNATEYITRLGIKSEKIVWIPNGVDLEKFDKTESVDFSSVALKTIDEKKEKFKIVYTGVHGRANGLDNVIEAAASIAEIDHNIHFVFVGDGPEKERLIRMVDEKSVTNISFLDSVPKSAIAEILKRADLLLHCLKPMEVLKYGISPNKLYDYLASSKPVIMATGTTNRVVEEADAGIVVEPDNPQALAQGILKIKHMSVEERNRMGYNGRVYVEKFHDTKKLGDKLIQLLEEVTNKI